MPRQKKTVKPVKEPNEELEAEDVLFKPKLQLKIKELDWTQKQRDFFRLGLDDNTRIVILSGPAGTSKTLMAVYCGLKLMNEGKISDMMYLRSAVESSEAKLGFLPGSAEEKLSFYNLPFLDKISELVTNASPQRLITENKIEMFPVNFARGLNWSHKFVILDEAQNSTKKELTTVLTRLSKGSKCFILGDPMQTDLRHGTGGALEKMMHIFGDEESAAAGVVTFKLDEEDIMRDELVKFLVKKLRVFD
jgi:phosphate starvation-inducible protein PhoH and related proteins